MIDTRLARFVVVLMVCVGCGSEGISPERTVHAITVTPTTSTVAVGNTVSLVATVDADAGVPSTVSWTSSAPSVATVSTTGVVTGVATGLATIVVRSTVAPAVSASVPIGVISGIVGISITPSPLTLSVGARVVAKAAVAGFQGANVSQSVTWETTGGSYFTVSSDGTMTGVAVGSGGTLRARSTVDTSIVSPAVAVTVTGATPSDPCATRVFDLSVPVTGSLTTASCLDTSLGSFGDRTYGDWYSYTTTSTSLIRLRMASTSFTPVIAPVATRGGRFSARSNPFGGDDTVFVLVPAGTTTMFAGTKDPRRIGSYTLDAALNPPVPACNPVFTGVGVTGTFTIKRGCGFTPQGLTGFFDYQDFFVNHPGGNTLTVRVTSSEFIPLVEIRDNDSTISSLGQNQSTITLTYAAQSGGAFPLIYVASRSGSLGTFTITIER